MLCIHVVVEVGGYNLVTHPTGDTDHQSPCAGGLLHVHSHVSIPWVVGDLLQSHLLAPNLHRGFVACEEIHVQFRAIHSVDILRQ